MNEVIKALRERRSIRKCVIGYPEEVPEAAPRKDGRIYWLTDEK